MGLTNLLRGNRIYLDSNIWIYALENVPEYSSLLVALFELAENGSLTIITSELTLSEVLVRPIRKRDTAKQTAYVEAITATENTTAVPISRNILLDAAKVRSDSRLKLPDAIHAASAIATSCTTFLTNDKQFRTVQGLHMLLLSQVAMEFDEKE